MPGSVGAGPVLTLLVAAVAACGGTSPSSTPATSLVSTPEVTASIRPPASPPMTPSPPYPAERWERSSSAIIEAFAADLAGQYDGIDRDALDRWFTPEGLASALDHDWQLQAVLGGDLLIDGDVALRSGGTSREAFDADPPLVEIDLVFVIEPTSWLIDADSGAPVERFDHPRYTGATYALRYEVDTDRWRVTSVAATSRDAWVGPAQPRPPVRCPGLDPDAPASHPVATTVWCLGGNDGIRAYSSQVMGWEAVPCGATDVTVLTVGWPIGEPIDPYDQHAFVRDPDGDFDRSWPLEEPWDGAATMPADAYSTGLTDGEYEVWVSPARTVAPSGS
jgi:hypothetical protein